MCYAIPAKLIHIDGHRGTADYFGEQRQILMDPDEASVGDYIFAQGGVLVRRIPDEEAEEILAVWKDIFFELKETDERLAASRSAGVPENLLELFQKVNLSKQLSNMELLKLLNLSKKEELSVLAESANAVRQKVHGNASCVHGIIEFSNHCRCSCHYCGLRREHDVLRYRLPPDEIVQLAQQAVQNYGFKALVLQSGEDPWYTRDILMDIVRRVKALGVLVFISIGERSRETYKALWEAGARAALLRFETSNPEIYRQIRPGRELTDRISLIRFLKNMGFVTATGFILGLPGESVEDRLNNILLTKNLNPDMTSFGPLIPTGGTPLASEKKQTLNDMLKMIAVCRLADFNSNILVTTALETLAAGSPESALNAGANSMMINLTPDRLKKLYRIYDDRAGTELNAGEQVRRVTELLLRLGRAPTDIGDIRHYL